MIFVEIIIFNNTNMFISHHCLSPLILLELDPTFIFLILFQHSLVPIIVIWIIIFSN